ncbi:hypothetical protein [Paenibacillus sp. XY044]|uniref:hypothetical protein n=1 Tax=Paenibacillus sp. XY044 TaxID=2026089 RepID=UPI0011804AFE|nr:hypothetical protein [Paenibacillus sp. XY044]
MFRKLVFTTLSVALISGAALTANLLAVPSSDIPSSSKISVPEESLANSTDTKNLSVTEESSVNNTDSNSIESESNLNGLGEIYTKHGVFVRVEKQTFFDETEIAREKYQIGDKTKQLILNYGIFLRSDIH